VQAPARLVGHPTTHPVASRAIRARRRSTRTSRGGLLRDDQQGLRLLPSATTHFETDQAAREASGAHLYGRYLEEFEVGAVYKHWPAKTVTEADDHLFCLITMNHHPLHINDVYAHESQQDRNVVVGPARVLACARHVRERRQRQGDRQPRRRGAQAPAPVFHGDTLFCEPEVLAKIRDCGALLTASTSREQAAGARPTLDQTGIGLLRRESAILADSGTSGDECLNVMDEHRRTPRRRAAAKTSLGRLSSRARSARASLDLRPPSRTSLQGYALTPPAWWPTAGRPPRASASVWRNSCAAELCHASSVSRTDLSLILSRRRPRDS
jgi:acyl dehydratase